MGNAFLGRVLAVRGPARQILLGVCLLGVGVPGRAFGESALAEQPVEVPHEDEAPAATSLEDGRQKIVDWAARQTPPCSVVALARRQETFWLACGRAGLWRVTRDPEGLLVLQSREERGGEVVGFVRSKGELLVLVDLDLRVLQPLDRSQVVPPSELFVPSNGLRATDPTSHDHLPGRVVAVDGIRVTVDLGPEQVGPGNRVEFRWDDEVVIGRVLDVEATRSVVMIGLHEPPPPVGTPAQPTPRGSTSRVMGPPLGSYHYAFDLGLRVGVSGDGIFGAEGGISARYGYLGLTAEVRPFAFSTRGIDVAQAFVSAGLSAQWFGLSLGVGTSTVNMHNANPPGTGVLVTPALRFGAIDGLNVRARAGTTLHRQEMRFSALIVDMQIPVSRAFALLLEGAGGDFGLAEGEAGLRSLLRGNGGPGSWFVKTSGGVTVLQQGSFFTGAPFANAIAPHLRLVVETRL